MAQLPAALPRITLVSCLSPWSFSCEKGVHLDIVHLVCDSSTSAMHSKNPVQAWRPTCLPVPDAQVPAVAPGGHALVVRPHKGHILPRPPGLSAPHLGTGAAHMLPARTHGATWPTSGWGTAST